MLLCKTASKNIRKYGHLFENVIVVNMGILNFDFVECPCTELFTISEFEFVKFRKFRFEIEN